MTLLLPASANAVTRHSEMESFRDYAHGELEQAAPWVPGVCFLPQCSCSFSPNRPWQLYCSTACEKLGKAELRSWGHKAALPLLTHRMFYVKGEKGTPEADLMNAARRYLWRLQTEWIKDRARRKKEAGHGV